MNLGAWLIVLLIPYTYATIVVTDVYDGLDYDNINVYTYDEEESLDDSSYDSYDDYPVDVDYREPAVPYIPLIFSPNVDTAPYTEYY